MHTKMRDFQLRKHQNVWRQDYLIFPASPEELGKGRQWIDEGRERQGRIGERRGDGKENERK